LVNILGQLQWLLAYYVFSFSGLRPQTPTRTLPLDPAGGLLSPVPVLSSSETNKGYGLEDEQAATARSAVAACLRIMHRSCVCLSVCYPLLALAVVEENQVNYHRLPLTIVCHLRIMHRSCVCLSVIHFWHLLCCTVAVRIPGI